MKYIFKLADKALLDKIYNLYEKRIEWMDEVGIKQWNTTNYMRLILKVIIEIK